MGDFYYRTNQDEFNEAFGGLSAAEAADLILGRRPLTTKQAEALRFAMGGGNYSLRFDPKPVGHIKFAPVETRGTGNHGWHRMVPATKECRRLVNAARREEFAARLGAPRPVADRIFSELGGYEPAIAAAVKVWPLLTHCPEMSNQALRDAGFRPGHPHEGWAISVIRKVLKSTPPHTWSNVHGASADSSRIEEELENAVEHANEALDHKRTDSLSGPGM